MKKLETSLNLEILVYVYRSYPKPIPRQDDPLVKIGIRALEKACLIAYTSDKGHYSITERGSALIDCLKNIPLPKAVWVNPVTNEVI